MSTTTITYNVIYTHSGNTTTWSGSVTSPLQITGAATKNITTAGTTILSTANKLCNSNLVIGGNTLACANKMMASNITINTTATTYYYWDRYTIATYYTRIREAYIGGSFNLLSYDPRATYMPLA